MHIPASIHSFSSGAGGRGFEATSSGQLPMSAPWLCTTRHHRAHAFVSAPASNFVHHALLPATLFQVNTIPHEPGIVWSEYLQYIGSPIHVPVCHDHHSGEQYYRFSGYIGMFILRLFHARQCAQPGLELVWSGNDFHSKVDRPWLGFITPADAFSPCQPVDGCPRQCCKQSGVQSHTQGQRRPEIIPK